MKGRKMLGTLQLPSLVNNYNLVYPMSQQVSRALQLACGETWKTHYTHVHVYTTQPHTKYVSLTSWQWSCIAFADKLFWHRASTLSREHPYTLQAVCTKQAQKAKECLLIPQTGKRRAHPVNTSCLPCNCLLSMIILIILFSIWACSWFAVYVPPLTCSPWSS